MYIGQPRQLAHMGIQRFALDRTLGSAVMIVTANVSKY